MSEGICCKTIQAVHHFAQDVALCNSQFAQARRTPHDEDTGKFTAISLPITDQFCPRRGTIFFREAFCVADVVDVADVALFSVEER